MLRLLRPVAAVLLAGLLAGCDIQVGDNGVSVDVAQGRARDEWRRTYTLSPGGRLEINNANGGIEVAPASGATVEIVAERTVRSGSDEEATRLLQSLEMTEEASPDRVKIELQRPEGSRRGGWGRNNVTLRYVVRVPAGLNLSFATGNGGVRLEDVAGRVEASTTNGGITAERLSGSIKATSVNGGIRVELASVTGEIEAAVTNGGIRLELPRNTKASLTASCVNGGIEVDDDMGFQATETSRRQVLGTFNGGGPTIIASTVNGGINISTLD